MSSLQLIPLVLVWGRRRLGKGAGRLTIPGW